MTGQSHKRSSVAALPGSADPRAGKYLTFRLGQEEFGIQVLRVKEIMGVQDIAVVPGMPPQVRGVLNLRGKSIPVLDLRLRFGFPDVPFIQPICIVAVQVVQDGESAIIGLVVDAISEVLTLSGSDIEDPSDFGERAYGPFVLGIVRHNGSSKILLRIEDAVTVEELHGFQALVQ